MARRKRDTVFTEIAGKTVKSIKYEENCDYQVLELAFNNGALLISNSAPGLTFRPAI